MKVASGQRPRNAWLNWSDFTTMERPWRVNHRSHDVVLNWIQTTGQEGQALLDCGVLSAVTCAKIQARQLKLAYTGVDIAPQIIADCRRRFPDIDWREMDVGNLDFPQDAFDVVLVRHVLEHLPYYETALAEVHRVTRDRAVFCLFYPLQENDQLVCKEKLGGIYHENRYGADAFLAFLRARFQEVRRELVSDPQRPNELVFCRGKIQVASDR